MKKKSIFLLTIPAVILIAIIVIFSLPSKENNWIDNILDKNYEISALDCDGATKVLDKNSLKKIKSKWNALVDNGPFLGNIDTCYKKIIIDYDSEIVDIEIVDDNTIIVKEASSLDYYTNYTNAKKLVKLLNTYFE